MTDLINACEDKGIDQILGLRQFWNGLSLGKFGRGYWLWLIRFKTAKKNRIDRFSIVSQALSKQGATIENRLAKKMSCKQLIFISLKPRFVKTLPAGTDLRTAIDHVLH